MGGRGSPTHRSARVVPVPHPPLVCRRLGRTNIHRADGDILTAAPSSRGFPWPPPLLLASPALGSGDSTAMRSSGPRAAPLRLSRRRARQWSAAPCVEGEGVAQKPQAEVRRRRSPTRASPTGCQESPARGERQAASGGACRRSQPATCRGPEPMCACLTCRGPGTVRTALGELRACGLPGRESRRVPGTTAAPALSV